MKPPTSIDIAALAKLQKPEQFVSFEEKKRII
jgi:hypothetical protein